MSLVGGTCGSGEREVNFDAEALRELFFYISVHPMELVVERTPVCLARAVIGNPCSMVLLQHRDHTD